jgi:hypothetical protein
LHFSRFFHKLTFPLTGHLLLNNSKPAETVVQSVSKTRFIIGGALFVGGFLSPLLIPLVTSSDLPGNWKAILSTGLVAGLPEVGMLLAVAVLGKQGFAQLKEMFLSRFRQVTEPSAVSLTRYRIGLLMFFTPLLLGWLGPYAEHFFSSLAGGSLKYAVFFDLVFAMSFVVLGAGFWEKIRSLFVHESTGSAETSRASTDSPEGRNQ